MLKNLGQEQRNCLAKADECAGKAAEATTEEERLQYRRLEQSYLTLARSYEFSERLLDFTKENSRRLKAWVEDDSPAPFFEKGQQFIEPTRCERCGQPAQLMHRAPDTTRPRFEVRMFECVCGHYTRRVVKS